MLIEKYVFSLPVTLSPSTIYYVLGPLGQASDKFEILITDATATPSTRSITRDRVCYLYHRVPGGQDGGTAVVGNTATGWGNQRPLTVLEGDNTFCTLNALPVNSFSLGPGSYDIDCIQNNYVTKQSRGGIQDLKLGQVGSPPPELVMVGQTTYNNRGEVIMLRGRLDVVATTTYDLRVKVKRERIGSGLGEGGSGLDNSLDNDFACLKITKIA